MPRRASLHPTQAELEVLNVLWRRGPSTVRQVHRALQADRQTILTTTLKILQVMTDKGLTSRSDTRPHVYSPTIAQAKTQAGLVADLVQRAFDGSVRKLLIRAVEDTKLDPDELREIHRAIGQLRKQTRGEQS